MNLNRKAGYIGLALIFLISIFAVDVLNLVSPALAVSYGVLTKSPSNPVVTSGAATDSGATVIYDGGTYKMWYVETSITDTMRVDLYNHMDTPLKSDLAAGHFSNVANNDSAAIKSFLDYLSTNDFTSYINSITTTLKYATSSNGTSWSAPQTATLTPTTSWDQFISSICVINDGGTYKMWYTGNKVTPSDLTNLFLAIDSTSLTAVNIKTLLNDIVAGNVTQLKTDIGSTGLKPTVQDALTKSLTMLGSSKPAIGYASSPSTDGINWTKSGSNPVLVTSGWDNTGVMTPAVIKNTDGSFDMWYTGASISLSLANLSTAVDVNGVQSALLGGVNMAIGHAHAASGNGDSGWAKDANPVLSKGNSADWDNYGVFAPAVINNTDGTYDMWYTGVKGNLSTLSTYLTNPLHNLDNTVFTGASTAIGHATLANSSATATPDPAAVLNKGATGDWDNFGVAFPSVVLNGGNLNLWYTGIKVSPGAAVTSFFGGNNSITTILAAGGGTNAKIGFASVVIPPPTTTTTTTPPPSGGGGGGGGGFGPPPAGVTNVYSNVDPNGFFKSDMTAPSGDNLCWLTIPKGTDGLTYNGRALSQISLFPATTQPTLPAGFQGVGIFYDIGPSGTTFNPAITISFSYKNLTLPAGMSENNIVLGWIDAQGAWNPLVTTVDTVNKVVTAQVTHFTLFGLVSSSGPIVTTTTPAVPATFTTTKFTISPSQALVNQAIAVSVLVTNTGSASSTFSIDLKIDNTVTDTKKITLAGGSSDTVTFNVTKATAGTYTISIGGDTGKLVVSDVPVVSTPTVKPAAFSTANLSITPKTMKPGDTATVSVSVTNTGSLQGTYSVVLKINGATEDSRDVTLAGGDTKSVSFTITKSQPGSYAISVDSLSASLVVQASAISSPVTGTTTSSKNNTPIIIGAIIGAILGLFLALLLVQYMIRPATFNMSGLSIMPPLVTPGATAHVNVKVSNTGNKHGTYKVTMKVNGVIEGSQDVTLQKGANQVVGFTVVKNNPGIYMITIDNVSGRLVVQDQSGEESPQTDKAKPRNWPGLFH